MCGYVGELLTISPLYVYTLPSDFLFASVLYLLVFGKLESSRKRSWYIKPELFTLITSVDGWGIAKLAEWNKQTDYKLLISPKTFSVSGLIIPF